ncbi:MAG: ethanolamine ammonia-lyase reactivating factor EutA [Clostridia bacterium]|nr:ethanolamine ammonia-lyase reactivating factor EutA [Clostridia bacterium]
MAEQEILSVGIDIGTSTTQTVFSRLKMQNTAGFFAVPKIAIVEKKIVYRSSVHLTPLIGRSQIDSVAVKKLVQEDFREAGFTPKDTATGAVIITGEAARKENAAVVLEELSGFAGEFVVATAGPDLESVIAGKGSGAWQYSVENACAAVNFDIGGGTTNVALFYCGEVVAKGCLDIGGRQVCIDKDGKISYVSASAAKVAESILLDIKASQKADKDALKRLCDKMAELLEDLIAGKNSILLQAVTTKGSTPYEAVMRPDAVFFSGGVADCIYQTYDNSFEFYDVGILLGKAIRDRRFFGDYSVVSGAETIRATVVGAGSYTTTISGSTIFYSKELFPLKNLLALKPNVAVQEECLNGKSDKLKDNIIRFIKETDKQDLILCIDGETDPSYTSIKLLGKAVTEACNAAYPMGVPIVVAVKNDMAKALGQTVFGLVNKKREVVVIDSIRPEHGDYVDLGKPLMGGLAVPVVVKSLIFG